ncbi:MAG TPA: hypothetical protein VGE10_11120 [Zeimonas sp.]
MAEVNSYQAAELAAGRKLAPATHNRLRTAYFRTPTTHAIANGDTMGSGLTLPAGARIVRVRESHGAGAASSTVDVGVRNPTTKVAIVADAIVKALALTSAGVSDPVTGTKILGGADYVLPSDAELYATFGGATPTANQQVAFWVDYIAP